MLDEPPFALGGLAGSAKEDLATWLARLVVAGRSEDAVTTMQIDGIGLPAGFVKQIRRSPMWPNLVAVAQTVYDATLTTAPNLPPADVPVETLVLAGSETWPALRRAAAALPERLARAHYVELAGGADPTPPPPGSPAEAVDRFLSSRRR